MEDKQCCCIITPHEYCRKEASAESKAALQVPHAQNPAPLTSDASPRIIESHQQARYAAQETPIRDKKRSCSKFIFSQLSPYLPTWVRVCLGLRYCSCSLLSPSCFRSLHSLTSYLFPLALSPSLRFDVGALRALTAKLLFPSWLLPDGVLLGGGRGLWCAIGKLEVEGWHCLCGPVHTPAEGSISQIRSLPSVHVSLYMNRVTTARPVACWRVWNGSHVSITWQSQFEQSAGRSEINRTSVDQRAVMDNIPCQNPANCIFGCALWPVISVFLHFKSSLSFRLSILFSSQSSYFWRTHFNSWGWRLNLRVKLILQQRVSAPIDLCVSQPCSGSRPCRVND